MKRNTLARALAMLMPAAVVAAALIVPAASSASAAEPTAPATVAASAPAAYPAALAAEPAVRVRPATGWQGRGLQLRYVVSDSVGATATVVVTVSDAEAAPLFSSAPQEQSTGEWHSVTWMPPAAGEYSFVVTAEVSGAAAGASTAAPVHALPLSRSVAGRSLHGRAIAVTHFGAGDRRLLLLGGVHGDEYGAPVARALERYLLAHPRALPAGASIDLVACANPDGSAARTRANARRVDLNRNLPTRNWRSRLRARDASSLLGLTGGRSPGSEPETKAVLELLTARYDVVVSLHSRAEYWTAAARAPRPWAAACPGSAACRSARSGTTRTSPARWAVRAREVRRPDRHRRAAQPEDEPGMCAALLEAAR